MFVRRRVEFVARCRTAMKSYFLSLGEDQLFEKDEGRTEPPAAGLPVPRPRRSAGSPWCCAAVGGRGRDVWELHDIMFKENSTLLYHLAFIHFLIYSLSVFLTNLFSFFKIYLSFTFISSIFISQYFFTLCSLPLILLFYLPFDIFTFYFSLLFSFFYNSVLLFY